MKVKFKNLGPIKNGEFDIKDLKNLNLKKNMEPYEGMIPKKWKYYTKGLTVDSRGTSASN
ncbi:hypothetical protein FSBG_00812 [Fusobacterium gonidiaformans 3-1-5R]|uniref:Uncharacterized protein n=1 Tax=Fusobacterium gonidiaformans 3-1-5R TaxID=469605 RepID=E5BE39_9FUSO|nr:hypothetical protein [Fusobacterium gonidiaformans]EFS21315.1 hypothetical protein FSBG_00812 [Fusobacterium gonidiaformans 3-1-5R]